jgi:hypothetical protein
MSKFNIKSSQFKDANLFLDSLQILFPSNFSLQIIHHRHFINKLKLQMKSGIFFFFFRKKI